MATTLHRVFAGVISFLVLAACGPVKGGLPFELKPAVPPPFETRYICGVVGVQDWITSDGDSLQFTGPWPTAASITAFFGNLSINHSGLTGDPNGVPPFITGFRVDSIGSAAPTAPDHVYDTIEWVHGGETGTGDIDVIVFATEESRTLFLYCIALKRASVTYADDVLWTAFLNYYYFVGQGLDNKGLWALYTQLASYYYVTTFESDPRLAAYYYYYYTGAGSYYYYLYVNDPASAAISWSYFLSLANAAFVS